MEEGTGQGAKRERFSSQFCHEWYYPCAQGLQLAMPSCLIGKIKGQTVIIGDPIYLK